jgi:hypothetical protein
MGGYGSSVPAGREAALARVKAPAIAVMVVGALSVLGSILRILFSLLGVGMAGMAAAGGSGDASGRLLSLMSGGIGIVFAVLGLFINGVAIFGGLKMSKLESYTMAWVGVIACAMPCTCCCLIGLPVAIWAAIVLMNEEVKAAFVG